MAIGARDTVVYHQSKFFRKVQEVETRTALHREEDLQIAVSCQVQLLEERGRSTSSRCHDQVIVIARADNPNMEAGSLTKRLPDLFAYLRRVLLTHQTCIIHRSSHIRHGVAKAPASVQFLHVLVSTTFPNPNAVAQKVGA